MVYFEDHPMSSLIHIFYFLVWLIFDFCLWKFSIFSLNLLIFSSNSLTICVIVLKKIFSAYSNTSSSVGLVVLINFPTYYGPRYIKENSKVR